MCQKRKETRHTQKANQGGTKSPSTCSNQGYPKCVIIFYVKVTPAVPSFLIQEWPEFKSGLDAEKIIGAIYHSELMFLMKWYVLLAQT